jgi:hypothetical protein
MPDIHAPSNLEPVRTPFLDSAGGQEQPTLTDIEPGEQTGPVRAPSPSRLGQPARPQGVQDHAAAAGEAPRVLRVDSAGERGRQAAVLVVVVLAAVVGIVVAVRSLAPSHAGYTRAQTGHSKASVRTMPHSRAERNDRDRNEAKPSTSRSRRIAAPARVPASSSLRAGVCVGSCASEHPAEAVAPAPLRSEPSTAQSAPVEEDGVEFGFEE